MPSLIRPPRSNTAEAEHPGMKRRKSSVPSLKSLPLAFRMKRKNTSTFEVQPAATEPFQASLLTLPTELQLQLAQYLSFSDLCSLRAVSRDSNQLITGPESAIARYWIMHKLHHVHRLYPAPSHNQWQYLTSQMHRWYTARHLAEMIAYHIQYKTLLYVQRHSPSNVLSTQVLAALLLPPIHSAEKKFVTPFPVTPFPANPLTPFPATPLTPCLSLPLTYALHFTICRLTPFAPCLVTPRPSITIPQTIFKRQ